MIKEVLVASLVLDCVRVALFKLSLTLYESKLRFVMVRYVVYLLLLLLDTAHYLYLLGGEWRSSTNRAKQNVAVV